MYASNAHEFLSMPARPQPQSYRPPSSCAPEEVYPGLLSTLRIGLASERQTIYERDRDGRGSPDAMRQGRCHPEARSRVFAFRVDLAHRIRGDRPPAVRNDKAIAFRRLPSFASPVITGQRTSQQPIDSVTDAAVVGLREGFRHRIQIRF